MLSAVAVRDTLQQLFAVVIVISHQTKKQNEIRSHFQASEESLLGAKLISGVGDSKSFPSLDSERQLHSSHNSAHTNSTVRGRTVVPTALLGEMNT